MTHDKFTAPYPSFIISGNIDIGALLAAYESFKKGLESAQSDLEKAGTIKLFEITYELAWKTLKRVLYSRGKDLNSPRPIIREAALEKLIDNPETWFEFIDERNNTVHTYNRAVANSIFADLHLFDQEVSQLISRLKNLR